MSPSSKTMMIGLALLLLLPTIGMAVQAKPAPNINTPSISPPSPGSNDQVTVSANVTGGQQGIQNVTVVYTTDAWKTTNTSVLASYNSTTHLASAHIPPQYSGGTVQYYIVAFDNSGNRGVNDNSTSYYHYTVAAPAFGTSTIMWVEVAVVLVAVGAGVAIYAAKRKKPSR